MIGSRTRVKVVKNKVAPPFKQVEFDIMYGTGISKMGDLLEVATGIDVVKKSGAWYSYKDSKIGQGRENSKAFLEENEDIANEIEAKVREYYGLDFDSENISIEEAKMGEEQLTF